MQKEIETMQNYYNLAIEYVVKYGFQVIYGVIILFLGKKLSEWVGKFVFGLCQKRHLDITLSNFLTMCARIMVLAFAALLALDKFGITISPFIASISALIFGASFAIQAPLSNYAAGLSLILTRPFVVGNTITVKGFSGVVEDVKLPCTVLSTPAGERITIPNKDIVGEVIINSLENRMVQTSIGISYHDDPEKAIEIINQQLKQFSYILTNPPPQVGLQSFGDSSVNIGIYFWAPTKENLPVLHAVNLSVYKALKKAGMTMPFPQRELRILSPENANAQKILNREDLRGN